MKNTKLILLTFVVGLISFGMIDSATTKEKTSELITWEQLLEEERLKKEIEELRIKEYHEDELQRFLHDIGHRESGNRYDITNTWGYMGRYQFGKATLKGLGYNVTKKEFLNNPQLQDSAMISLLNHNKEKLQSYGNGTKITSYMKQFSGYDIKLN